METSWEKHTMGYNCYIDNKWIGLNIKEMEYIHVGNKFIKLSPIIYKINYYWNAEGNKAMHLVCLPTLKQAKKIAEEYYLAWLSHKGIIP